MQYVFVSGFVVLGCVCVCLCLGLWFSSVCVCFCLGLWFLSVCVCVCLGLWFSSVCVCVCPRTLCPDRMVRLKLGPVCPLTVPPADCRHGNRELQRGERTSKRGPVCVCLCVCVCVCVELGAGQSQQAGQGGCISSPGQT